MGPKKGFEHWKKSKQILCNIWWGKLIDSYSETMSGARYYYEFNNRIIQTKV